MAFGQRENTIQTGSVSTANAAVTLKLPNALTGNLPATQTGGSINPIGVTQRWRIKSLTASFGGAAAPTTPATLTVTDGHFTWTFDVTVPLVLQNIDLQCGAGAEVDITLAAGGASLVGHINVAVVSEG